MPDDRALKKGQSRQGTTWDDRPIEPASLDDLSGFLREVFGDDAMERFNATMDAIGETKH